MAEKPWEGRFADKTDRSVEIFTSSIDVDRRLYAYDIEGSIAHCRMLARASIISNDEAELLVEGLGQIKRDIEHGRFEFDAGLEDVHMNIEARLLENVGKTAQKLHTARSRNDQVALDVRMYLKDETARIIMQIVRFKKILVNFAKLNIETVLPGYTHLQRAQPVLLAHHIMAYYEMFSRDQGRLQDSLGRLDIMPLGSAALAGTTYPIDREYTAQLLGFSKISANSIDSVSDRDFIIEFLAAASTCMVHFSRLSEEIILWSSSEFGFVELPDAFATGSSIMPQKKNPDIPELVRGKAGSVFGELMAVLVMMKSLPMAYNRDMQEDKKPLFSAVDTLKACVDIYIRMIPRLTVKKEQMRRATSTGFLNATDLADYLAERGMPFRKAHGRAGEAVSYAIEKNKELHELTIKELKSFSELIEADIFEVLTTDHMINRRTSAGGTATKNVVAAIEFAERAVNADMDRLLAGPISNRGN
jgi:argininosuccinate lyase